MQIPGSYSTNEKRKISCPFLVSRVAKGGLFWRPIVLSWGFHPLFRALSNVILNHAVVHPLPYPLSCLSYRTNYRVQGMDAVSELVDRYLSYAALEPGPFSPRLPAAFWWDLAIFLLILVSDSAHGYLLRLHVRHRYYRNPSCKAVTDKK